MTVAIIAGLFVAGCVALWIARRPPALRCPDCGRNLEQSPHLPRCRYWR